MIEECPVCHEGELIVVEEAFGSNLTGKQFLICLNCDHCEDYKADEAEC